ncbi:MAG TPA: hypothetical protein VKB88_13855 [Bryobacteraceae bacterium]|nr:hypothetical protein [Bryobacteraceae bacterium]
MKRQIIVRALAFFIVLAAWADIVDQNATVTAGAGFNFDTGKNGSGDITFTGSSITFTGSAKGFNLGNLGLPEYNTLDTSQKGAIVQVASTNPIPLSQLVPGDVFALLTNAGNLVKTLVTASTSSSVSFMFTTYGATSAGGVPAITDVQNNSSLIPDGFPNSGVAASALIVIHGGNLANPGSQAALQDSTKGLPTTLNGASATVASGGKTYPIAFYYAIPTQAAGVLPAGVPTGQATLTYTYSGNSATATFNVVPSAFGIDVYGANQAVVQDSINGSLIDFTHSAKAGQIVTVWGSGLGADAADSDTTYTSTPHAISTPVQVFVGGVQATDVGYSGASAYPGVHVVVFTMPSGVPDGCFNPIAILTGSGTSVLSNMPIVPVMSSGGICKDTYTGLTGDAIANLASQTSVRSGLLSVGQVTAPGASGALNTNSSASALFQKVTGPAFVGSGSFAIGTCAVNETFAGSISGTVTATGLESAAITVTGPSGDQVTLSKLPTVEGAYFAQLSAGAIPPSGGTFTFRANDGGDLEAFVMSVIFPSPILSWSNQSDSATVTRASGQTYNWAGGAPGTFVIMSGSSVSNGAQGSYSCIAPVEAKTFTVPSYILSGLPAGSGQSSIQNSTGLNTFYATGLDNGFAFSFVTFSVNSTWK